MLKTLAWKETRELLPLVALALLAQTYLVTRATGTQWGGFSRLISPLTASASLDVDAIPFIDAPYSGSMSAAKFLVIVAAVAGIGFGLWQTMREFNNGTFLFLLHRPLDRRSILGVKLALGVALCLLVGGLPLLYYTFWAATPGTHASPFLRAFTTSAWLLWLEVPLVYLGAFLSGLRPGRWFGSRFLPLIAALVAVYVLRLVAGWVPAEAAPWRLIALGIVFALDAMFVLVIFWTADTRDFS